MTTTRVDPPTAEAVALSCAREQLAGAELTLRACAGVATAHAAAVEALAAVDLELAVALGRMTPGAQARRAHLFPRIGLPTV